MGAVAVLQDISELESISRELENVKELNAELDAIIESSHDGIYLTDGEGITLRLNEAFEKLTGFSRNELLGRSVEDLVKERSGFSFGKYSGPEREKTSDHYTKNQNRGHRLEYRDSSIRSQGENI